MKQLLLQCFIAFFLFTISFSQKRVAIIGGGIAGVSAAHYLHQFDPTASITLFEKEAFLGGNAQTAEVLTNDGRKVMVDVGPQYFAKGPWDDYINFLSETIGWKNVKYESMDASLVIQKIGKDQPLVATPLNGKFRGEKFSNLLKLKKFNTAAYKVYKNPESWKMKTIEDWVESLDFDANYKIEVIYPFLGAALGTSVSEIKKTAAVEIISLFAFRKPKASNQFHIMTDGMGGLIQEVGEVLIDCGVEVKVSSPVWSVEQKDKQWEITYQEGDLVLGQHFDFVIFAVHADVAASLIKDEFMLDEVKAILQNFTYFDAQIVIHQDTNFIQNSKPAFLNIFTNTDNELVFTTMNLSMISNRTNGIYKSWLNAKDTEFLESKNAILHQQLFHHPMITTDFVKYLSKLKEIVSKHPQLEVIGGWTEGLETQNSAVLSARRAVESYKKYFKTIISTVE